MQDRLHKYEHQAISTGGLEAASACVRLLINLGGPAVGAGGCQAGAHENSCTTNAKGNAAPLTVAAIKYELGAFVLQKPAWPQSLPGLVRVQHLFQSACDCQEATRVDNVVGQQLLDAGQRRAHKLGRLDLARCQEGLQDFIGKCLRAVPLK